MSGSNVAIIGLGKIGGSLGLALRASGHTVTGCDRYIHVAGAAVARGAADAIAPDPIAAAAGAEVVVVATPVAVIMELVPRLTEKMQKGALLLDTGSVKSGVVATMNEAAGEVRSVGGHPIAGNELKGFESWDAKLFAGRTFALTETQTTDDDARRRAERLVADVAAVPHWFDAGEHDELVATTSHVPLLLSVALARQVGARIDTNERVRRLIGGQLRSATRMSDSPAAMLADIFRFNGDNVRRAMEELGRDALKLVEDARAGKLEDELREVAEIRNIIEKS